MSANQQARELLAQALGINASALPDEATITTVERWDSLGHMRLLLAIEEKLARELSADEAIAIDTLDDVIRLIETTSER